MSDRGERGPQGDHGQAGDTGATGDTGLTGEAGPVGDTGATGDTGLTGHIGVTGQRGQTGQTGEQGPHYSSWLTRRAVFAYGLMALGLVLSVVFTNVRFDQATARTDRKVRELCEAGNVRSQLQAEDYETSAAQTEAVDLERVLGVTPEGAAEVRRLSRETADRRIMAVPFLDCRTGERR